MKWPSKQPVLTTGLDFVPREPLVAWCGLLCPRCRAPVRTRPASIAERALRHADADAACWRSAVNCAPVVRVEAYDRTTRRLVLRVCAPLCGRGTPTDLRARGAHLAAVCGAPATAVECTPASDGAFLRVCCTWDARTTTPLVVRARLCDDKTEDVLVEIEYQVSLVQM